MGTPQPLRTLSTLGENRFEVVYWLALAVGIGTVVGALYLLRSRLGLALNAIRDDEEAATASGVDVRRVKLTVYLVVAAMTGLVGAIYLLNNVSIDPDSYFSIGLTAQMVIVVVVGGLGTIEGPIVGSIIYFLLDENLRRLGAWWFIVLGLFLLIVILLGCRRWWVAACRNPPALVSRSSAGSWPTGRGVTPPCHDGATLCLTRARVSSRPSVTRTR